MLEELRSLRRQGATLVIAACVCLAQSALGQAPADGFVTGQAARAWEQWTAAMESLLNRDPDKAEQAFTELVTLDASPLRLALLGDRTLKGPQGGALVLFEQDAEAGSLRENGKTIFERYRAGAEQMNQADDGFYFALVGQFPISNANFRALLESDPDPVALVEFVDRVPRREEILVLATSNPVVGEAAREVMKLLAEGERRIKSDPARIEQNIERLAGPPRQFENSVARLKDSGEYAAALLVATLRDAERRDLTPAILRTLPQLDRPAVLPLAAALKMPEDEPRVQIVRVLGQIGYAHAVPFLLQLRDAESTSPALRAEVDKALINLSSRGVNLISNRSAAESFVDLAGAYLAESPSLRADPRLDTANVWYWKDGVLGNYEVPTPIYNEVMAMRCTEEALQLNPDLKQALALWIAANFRREAQLPEGATDPTRPENFPPASYFAQSAGPEYCLAALARAIDDRDVPSALGAIAALRRTAGPASLVAGGDARHPLAEALSFPDRMVRVRAALALASALPDRQFPNYQNLTPALAEAVTMFGGSRTALVVDSSDEGAGLVAAGLRAAGYTVVTDARVLTGLTKARSELAGVDAIFLASDIESPGLAEAIKAIREEYRFAALPIVVVAKPGQADLVRSLVRGGVGVGSIPAGSDSDALVAELTRVGRAIGAAPVTPEVGQSIAMEALQVLKLAGLAESGVVALGQVEPALLTTLGSSDLALRVAAAEVLAFICTETAQRGVAKLALSDAEPAELRAPMLAALAESGRRCSNKLDQNAIKALIAAAEGEADMTLRGYASQALGALNLPGNPASAIVRNLYGD